MLREPARLIAYRRLLLDVLPHGRQLPARPPAALPPAAAACFPRSSPAASTRCATTSRCWRSCCRSGWSCWPPSASPRPGQVLSLRREALKELQVAALGVVLLAAGGYLLRLHFVSRPFLLLFGVINGAVLAAARVVERRTALGPQARRGARACGGRRRVRRGGGGARAPGASPTAPGGSRLRGLVDADGCGRAEVEGFPVVGRGRRPARAAHPRGGGRGGARGPHAPARRARAGPVALPGARRARARGAAAVPPPPAARRGRGARRHAAADLRDHAHRAVRAVRQAASSTSVVALRSRSCSRARSGCSSALAITPHLARPGALPAGALRAARAPLRAAQVPHHGRGRREDAAARSRTST